MSLFNRRTTKEIYLGTPEAEAEANINARIKLEDVFEDFLSILPELETEKFIITGRKGQGKSAIGQILLKRSKASPNEFCAFIRKNDINLEEMVQISSEAGHTIQKEVLFKWIILTRIIKLLTENEAVKNLKDIRLIREFLSKNTGFVDINRYEIKSIIMSSGFDIFIEKLVRFINLKKSENIQLSGQKAPFYKLIPHLESVILSILTSHPEVLNENKYLLLFDDLDIEFKAENDDSVETLLNLIRIAKHYNNNYFSENHINAKVVILLRDDITDVLIKKSADMGKIFSSYSIPIAWYEHELYKVDENLTKLKLFINKRIAKAFEARSFTYDKNDPWTSLIDTKNSVSETSFKYVIDHTFQTPRDLLLYFQDLPKYQFQIPLTLHDLNLLIGLYANKVKDEIENALAIHFKPAEIENIFQILKSLTVFDEFKGATLLTEIKSYFSTSDNKRIAEILFDYSLIGNKKPNSNTIYFKYRDNNHASCNIDFEKPFILHRIISIYFKNIKT